MTVARATGDEAGFCPKAQSTVRRRNLKTRFHSENASNIFRAHFAGGIWKRNNDRSFEICVWGNSVREPHYYCDVILFEKLCFNFFFFQSTIKHKVGFFKFLRFEERFLNGVRNCLVSTLILLPFKWEKLTVKRAIYRAKGFTDIFSCFYFAGNRKCGTYSDMWRIDQQDGRTTVVASQKSDLLLLVSIFPPGSL